MTVPELLAPAGGERQLKAAVRFGADAVYLALTRNGMRARATNFDRDALTAAAAFCHAHSVRVYLTLNIFPRDEDIDSIVDDARFAREAGVDALIMADPGAIMAVARAVPGVEIHLSTQQSTLNAASARFWFDQGVRRIVLARELTLSQITGMRQRLGPTGELEAFVHGAVCMAYSGRCALSKYLTGRDADRGDCAQPCRWRYRLEEQRRPGVYFPVEQTDEGVSLFSAGDLNMIRHIDLLCGAGLHALKIEGRMKNEYYVATVVSAYRKALDAVRDGRYTPEMKDQLSRELDMVSHRPYDTGFYFGPPERPGGNDRLTQTREFCGAVLGYGAGRATVRVKRRLRQGDQLELMTPAGVTAFAATDMRLMDGTPTADCAVPDTALTMPVPCPCEDGDLIRGENLNHL